MVEILKLAQEWSKQKRQLALATVISTWGSAPMPSGSQLLIDGDGNFEGSVSGGCVEGAVIHEAFDVIKTGIPKVLEYQVVDDNAFEVGLACGGDIRIYLEPVE